MYTNVRGTRSPSEKWKPKIECGCEPGSWILKTEIKDGSVEYRIRGSDRKFFVNIGKSVYHVKPSELRAFGEKHDIALVDLIGILDMRWQRLNLLAEFE